MVDKMRKCSRCNKMVSHWSLNGYDRCGECQLAVEHSNAVRIANEQQDVGQLKTGDRIIITLHGHKMPGKVISAENYGGRDGWYIEFTHDSGAYGYWKQGPDGGKVERA